MNETSNKTDYSKFIEALEIIYALFFAVGLYNVLDNLKIDWFYIPSLVVCVGILIRFFFAPSKNIQIIIENIRKSNLSSKEKDKKYRTVLLIDVPILFFHAVIIVKMCDYITKVSLSDPDFGVFQSFLLLLITNTIWLVWIKRRIEKLKGKCEDGIKFWIKNNALSSIPISIILCLPFIPLKFLCLPFSLPVFQFSLLLFCAVGNCIVDLWVTYKAYLFHSLPRGNRTT